MFALNNPILFLQQSLSKNNANSTYQDSAWKFINS